MSEPKRPRDVCVNCWANAVTGMTAFDRMRVKWRPAPHPGPRCVTHHREVTKARKAKAHESRVQAVYGLGPGEYELIYRGQDGRCALCLRATGATRKLSVDHDHATGLVRGLLCRPCNTLLGHARDSEEFFLRCIGYLQNPPAQSILGGGNNGLFPL